MKLSLYTILFERDNKFYLYNSETEFLSLLSEDIYEKLYNGAYNEIEKEFIDVLKEKKIIIDDEHQYDFYDSCKLSYLSNIGVTDSLSLVIAPTTGCNFACPYCFEGEKKTKVISDDVIENLICFINGYSSVKKLDLTWYGGEPLMAFDKIKQIILKIRNNCKVKICSQSIITNGYLLSDNVIRDMINLGFTEIQISFDGDEENHNKTRFLKGNKGRTFAKIINNLDNLVRQVPDDFKIDLRINVNKDNENDFAPLYKKFIQRYGTHKVNPYPGFIRETSKDGCKMCYKSLFDIKRFQFYKRIEKEGVPVDFFPHIDLQKGCMVNRNSSFIIGPSGEMYKCWNDFNSPERIIGNIQNDKLKNPTLVSHYLYDTSIYNTQKCKDCALFPVCDGGCQWFKHKNIFEGKQYNTCCFLNNQQILKECLLEHAKKDKEDSYKIYAI
ncbi:radical SAM/SPASM domain-containing protein [Prevotella dentasini]|uniref:radical SAM/SPASM domain-containing protein n=1 Tax=Prevotella dentasini TaxID=589537 RepID=UPI000A83724B|nr:radical SAM protein [Prevotella dentasini]